MSDSYHFQIEPEPAKEALFRIGGVYRDGHGRVVRLSAPCTHAAGCASVELLTDRGEWTSYGVNRLSDGRYPSGADDATNRYHLIPGELVERDGEWVPAATIGPFPSGATLTVSGDKVVGRTEPEPQRAPLPNSDAWRYTGKERDDFPEFVVTRETVIDFALPLNKPMPKGGTLHAHPGVGSALLRG